MENYDLVVIGGGAAGIASAISAKNHGVNKVLIVEKDKELGGILQQCIHNGFGLHIFTEELTGPQYAERYINLLKENRITVWLNSTVLDIKSIGDQKEVYISNDKGYHLVKAKVIIFAVGCRERTRGAIDIPGSRPAGVMTAGTAQRYINMEGYLVGKKVFILGSGDIGLIMARRLTLEGAKVIGVAEILSYSNGLTRNIVQCLNDYNIPLYLSHTVTNISGKHRVQSITISEVDENMRPIEGTDKKFDVDTVLLSVGLIPDNILLEQIGVDINPITKGAYVNESLESSIQGIFVCGNALHVHDLVDYVSEEGSKAGFNAAKYLRTELVESNPIEIIACKGIKYCIPNYVRLENVEKNLELLFRVDNVYIDKFVKIKCGDRLLYKKYKPHIAPSEMQKIIIPKSLLKNIDSNNIEIYLAKKGEDDEK